MGVIDIELNSNKTFPIKSILFKFKNNQLPITFPFKLFQAINFELKTYRKLLSYFQNRQVRNRQSASFLWNQ